MLGDIFGNPAAGLFGIAVAKNWRSKQISSYDRTGGNQDFVTIPPGGKVVVGEIEGAGCISRIWFTIRSRDPDILRRVILRFYWDGEEDPSVETPFGDFFGCGFAEYSHHISLMQGMTSGGYVSYWPMPFSDGARLEVHNLSDREVGNLYYNIQCARAPGGGGQMGEMLQAAEDIGAGRLSEYTERRSVAVNYDVLVRRFQFGRFSLSVRADLFSDE